MGIAPEPRNGREPSRNSKIQSEPNRSGGLFVRERKSTVPVAIAGTATTARSTHATTRSEVRRTRVRFSHRRLGVRCPRARGFRRNDRRGATASLASDRGVPTFFKIGPIVVARPFSRRSRAGTGVDRARASARGSHETTGIGTIDRDDARRGQVVLLLEAAFLPLTFPSLSRLVFFLRLSLRLRLFASGASLVRPSARE